MTSSVIISFLIRPHKLTPIAKGRLKEGVLHGLEHGPCTVSQTLYRKGNERMPFLPFLSTTRPEGCTGISGWKWNAEKEAKGSTLPPPHLIAGRMRTKWRSMEAEPHCDFLAAT